MKLLALLILLALRRVEWQHDPERWRRVVDRLLLAPWPLAAALAGSAAGRLLVLVLLWAAVGFVVRFGLDDFLLSLPLLALYVALLWALVGRDRLGADLNEYLRLWFLHDAPALRRFAGMRFALTLPVDVSPGALHRAVLRALFVRAFRESFIWIIVFAFTGLPGLLVLAAIEAVRRAQGADAVRLDALLPQVAAETRARVDWLAVRLLGATLLLTGNSSRAWPVLDNRVLDEDDPAEDLAADLCVAAAGLPLQPADEPDVGLDVTDARGLLLRTQVVWILLMALSVIVGF
ncbi:MAG: regulatory signaling modulator protein AmpE [Pseudomonadota bacterium]